VALLRKRTSFAALIAHIIRTTEHITGWRRPSGCFIIIHHVLQNTPIISDSFAKNDLRLKISNEGMGANQLFTIVVGISSQIGRDGHRDMGDVSTYGKIIRNLLGSMKPPGSNLCADTRRYKYLRTSQGVKTQRDLHWVERGLTFWIFGNNPRI